MLVRTSGGCVASSRFAAPPLRSGPPGDSTQPPDTRALKAGNEFPALTGPLFENETFQEVNPHILCSPLMRAFRQPPTPSGLVAGKLTFLRLPPQYNRFQQITGSSLQRRKSCPEAGGRPHTVQVARSDLPHVRQPQPNQNASPLRAEGHPTSGRPRTGAARRLKGAELSRAQCFSTASRRVRLMPGVRKHLVRRTEYFGLVSLFHFPQEINNCSTINPIDFGFLTRDFGAAGL